jgi:CheY-like chemotaxis protein
MGGIETLRKIRADERLKNIPVVIVTCSILESDEQRSREAGATAFIHKAIRINDFSEDLGRHVKCLISK